MALIATMDHELAVRQDILAGNTKPARDLRSRAPLDLDRPHLARAPRSDKVRRCDLVAFVNGLPFVVIENERPTKDVEEGVSQLIGYQGADNIPHLFHFAQLLMATSQQPALRRFSPRTPAPRSDLADARPAPPRHRRRAHTPRRDACEPLNDSQRADLKRKFSRLEALSQTDQAVRTKALDISEHFRRHWKGTGFKAQLVAPSKAAAIRFKEALDGIGDVTSEVVISAPDDREGNEEVDEAPRGRVRAFWAEAMQRFGSEQEYNRRTIDAFKGPGDPEILIVVSRLLTGFDAPRNTVLYICKDMKEHTLLQAIERVNRLHAEGGESKKFGFIIDYQGLLGELDRALTAYSALEGYDPQDLAGAVVGSPAPQPHHGAAFHALLGRVMPDWEERKRRLEVAMA